MTEFTHRGGAVTETLGFKAVYWHRDLPPIDAQPIDEHSIEASSPRVPDTIALHDVFWGDSERLLASEVEHRLAQEVSRLGGRCAHVLDERIEVKRDPVLNEAWLHGRYTYVLYR